MSEVVDRLRAALDRMSRSARVIMVHPDHEADARGVVSESPIPGLLEVVVNQYCPKDRVFIVPKPIIPAVDEEDSDG